MTASTRLTRRQLLQRSTLLGLPAAWSTAHAQEVARILVGFPAGGAIDSTARAYAESLRELGPLIVENRPGAAGNIAAGALAQSRSDGNLLMFAPVNVYCISPTLYRNLPFQPARDFSPLGIVASFPSALAVHPSVPVRTLEEFVQWARAKNNQVDCGMAAIGSEVHLMAHAFAREAGINLNFVPYKGGAPMAQDLMAGHLPFAVDPIVNLAQPHKAGKLRILALTGPERSRLLPEVQTVREAGYPLATGETWIGASVRTGTSPARIQALQAALAAAAKKPELRNRLAAAGLAVGEPSGDEMGRTIVADTQRYADLVKSAELRLE